MSVIINDTCINCGACIDECPVEAIVDENDNPTSLEIYYVAPDVCVECVDFHGEPACATACPTEGCITWDMPFTEEFKDFFSDENYIENKEYVVNNIDKEQPYREDINNTDRKNREPIIS